MKQGGVFAALCYIATHFGAQEWVAKSIYKEEISKCEFCNRRRNTKGKRD